MEEENKQLQARLNDLIEQKEKLEQTVTQGNVGNKNEIESLKSDLENANAMIAALRNQRQELLAQIENLKFVKKVDTVNRYILLADDFGSLEIGPILKNDFIKKMKARGII